MLWLKAGLGIDRFASGSRDQCCIQKLEDNAEDHIRSKPIMVTIISVVDG